MTDDSPTPDLARLAEAHGVATEYWSFFGDRVQVPAPTLRAARDAAYAAVDALDWPEGFCRRDIGWRALGAG